jgi:hypothetical protein
MGINDYIWRFFSISLVIFSFFGLVYWGFYLKILTLFQLIGIGLLCFLGIGLEYFRKYLAIKSVKRSLEKKGKSFDLDNIFFNEYNGIAIPNTNDCVVLAFRQRSGFIHNYTIPAEKIRNSSVKTSTTEIIKSYRESSPEGILGGALMGGPLGAMIGGRIYSKTKQELKKVYDKLFLVIEQDYCDPPILCVIFSNLKLSEEYSNYNQEYFKAVLFSKKLIDIKNKSI